ncbi:cytochrome c [Chitinophaga pendula]|uniref:calcium-binding protein n=1 Tax=Chitinophaga TaxID=79328 RepID=UPI000BAF32EC|nr:MULTISPECIES: calcium-binding protein [Chitinophaga]ASZ14415.1 calcium-binding protein [Chitinophaga sp. MD30]UCJ07931.1 cytochrome c [Chitinophaga pendula]
MRLRHLFFLLVFLYQPLAAQVPTYYQHIAPLIMQHCASCHRPGEAAPFSLLTYEEVSKRASFISEVTESGYMPPWKADRHYATYSGQRGLSAEEIKLIKDWVAAKMPKGKPTPVTKKFVAGTQYHRPADQTLKVIAPYTIAGDNTERFVVFRIPFSQEAPMNVEAVEFLTNNKQAVHHANYAIYEADDDTDIRMGPDFVTVNEGSGNRYEEYAPLQKKLVYYGGWVPGAGFESYPEHIGWKMPKRGVILLTIHYAPSGKTTTEQSGVNLFFRKEAVRRTVNVVSIGSGGVGQRDIEPFFFIQPDTIKKFTLKVTTPQDQSLFYVWPHMHLLGKSFKAYATTPRGDTIPLVHIPQWDFNWQEIYWFPHPVKIPKGTVVTIEGTYDNTASNPANPFHPPRLIYSGGTMKSVDEMLTMVMLFLPYEAGDEQLRVR